MSLMLLLLVLVNTIVLAQSKDEVAIRAVLEGHSRAVLDKDAEKAISYYAQSPDLTVSNSTPGYPRGYAELADKFRQWIGTTKQKSTTTFVTDDFRYRIQGNMAFVSYIETYTRADGTVSKTHKADYLEKEKDEWKMLGNFWIGEGKPLLSQNMIEDWERAKAYTKAYLDAMPEDGYDFRPTPDIRSFAQQYLHTAAVNYRYLNFATRQPNPYPGDDLEKVKDMQSKAAVTKVTMESYDAVINALKNLTQAQLTEKAVWYEYETTKAIIFQKGLEHLTHHRGQTTIYLRLKGAIPPGEKLLNVTERMHRIPQKP